MKKIGLFICAVIAIALVACSGGSSSFNASICKELSDKIANNEEISEHEIDQMINQIVAINKVLEDKQKEAGDDAEKLIKLSQDETLKGMSGYSLVFTQYISSHLDNLSDSNKAHFEKAKKQLHLLR